MGGGCYAAVPAGPLNFIFLKEWIELLVIHQQLVWAKDSMVLGHSDYHYKHEPILYGWKPGAAHYFTGDRTKTSLLEFDRPKASVEHPTMKPVGLWAELIKNSSKAGDVVLDTFLGSGTTLIACEQLNRTCYGMEIEPKYCHVIIERYRKYCADNNKKFECKINGQDYP
jgi:DNA modification methylase